MASISSTRARGNEFEWICGFCENNSDVLWVIAFIVVAAIVGCFARWYFNGRHINKAINEEKARIRKAIEGE